MKTVDRLRKHFRYDGWANWEVLSSFHQTTTPPGRSLKLMAHILGTQYVWLSRIKGEKPLLAVWPELTLTQCEQHARQLGEIWSSYLEGLDEATGAKIITYQNTKGETWNNSVEDVLTHVVMHSAYHRGQIAGEMRGAGQTPAYTDYIHGVRQKLVG